MACHTQAGAQGLVGRPARGEQGQDAQGHPPFLGQAGHHFGHQVVQEVLVRPPATSQVVQQSPQRPGAGAGQGQFHQPGVAAHPFGQGPGPGPRQPDLPRLGQVQGVTGRVFGLQPPVQGVGCGVGKHFQRGHGRPQGDQRGTAARQALQDAGQTGQFWRIQGFQVVQHQEHGVFRGIGQQGLAQGLHIGLRGAQVQRGQQGREQFPRGGPAPLPAGAGVDRAPAEAPGVAVRGFQGQGGFADARMPGDGDHAGAFVHPGQDFGQVHQLFSAAEEGFFRGS